MHAIGAHARGKLRIAGNEQHKPVFATHERQAPGSLPAVGRAEVPVHNRRPARQPLGGADGIARARGIGDEVEGRELGRARLTIEPARQAR